MFVVKARRILSWRKYKHSKDAWFSPKSLKEGVRWERIKVGVAVHAAGRRTLANESVRIALSLLYAGGCV